MWVSNPIWFLMIGGMMSAEWLWYYGANEEGIYSGGYPTREDAIIDGESEYCGEGFLICRASNPPERLSDWISTEAILDHANDWIMNSDRINYEYDDDAIFVVSPEQEAYLDVAIKDAIDKWQEDLGLKFQCRTFKHMTDVEYIDGR